MAKEEDVKIVSLRSIFQQVLKKSRIRLSGEGAAGPNGSTPGDYIYL